MAKNMEIVPGAAATVMADGAVGGKVSTGLTWTMFDSALSTGVEASPTDTARTKY